MGVINDQGRSPHSIGCAAEAIYEGYVYKDDGSGRMTKITAKGDTAVAIAVSSSLDVQDASAKTMTAGDPHPFALLGSRMIVGVASVSSQVYVRGDEVYLSDDVDGMVVSSAATSRPIGHFVGVGRTTGATNGELIDVFLDTYIGEANI